MRSYFGAITHRLDDDDNGHRRRGKEIGKFEPHIDVQPIEYELNFKLQIY